MSKRYGTQEVLRDVTVSVRLGEVVGIAGENGAGKSTLLNIASGVTRPTRGDVWLRGQRVELRNYGEANALGVFRVFQELALVTTASVYENMYMGHEGVFRRFGILSHREMRKRAAAVCEEVGHVRLDVRRRVGELDYTRRQLVQILRAFAIADLLGADAPVLLLDEPTAGLAAEEVDTFKEILQAVRPRAATVFVGHNLAELLELTNEVVILKDGAQVGSGPTVEFSQGDVHKAMVGRDQAAHAHREDLQVPVAVEGVPLLRVEGLTRKGHFRDVSLDVFPGEIVGIVGVLGSGKSELGQAIWSRPRDCDGTVAVAGHRLDGHGAVVSLAADVGYVSPDRALDGAILNQPLAWNLTLAQQAQRASMSPVRSRTELADTRRQMERLKVKAPGPMAPMSALSGGNQQKVILGRWLLAGSRLLILDNPTRGVDVGAREDIYEVLRSLTATGVGILLIGDDLPEVIGLSHRVLVMKTGECVGTFDAPAQNKPTEVAVVAAMV